MVLGSWLPSLHTSSHLTSPPAGARLLPETLLAGQEISLWVELEEGSVSHSQWRPVGCAESGHTAAFLLQLTENISIELGLSKL